MRGKSTLLFGLILVTMLTGCVSSGGSSSGGGGNPPAANYNPDIVCMSGVAAALGSLTPGHGHTILNNRYYIVDTINGDLYSTTHYATKDECEPNRPTL